MSKTATPPVTRGYPGLANIMGAHKGMSIYLRFSDLNARDLLVYQAEILQLEQILEVQDQITPWAKTNILKQDGANRTPMEKEHWKVQMQLRCKLKDYSMSDAIP
jgi:GTP cyclohydrolase III